jgi:hypothetical protein
LPSYVRYGADPIKVGTLDHPDALVNAKPDVELYVASRPGWVAAIEGAHQKQAFS